MIFAGVVTSFIAIFTVWRMSREITVRRVAERSLREAHDDLERRVQSRTVELEKANESLQAEIDKRRKSSRQLKVQFAVSRVLAESSTIEQAAPRLLQVIGETLGWEVAEMWSVDSRMGLLRLVEMWNVPEMPADAFRAMSRQMTFGRGTGLPGRVWAEGEPVWIHNIGEDDNFPRAHIAQLDGLKGAFAFPILAGNEVKGVIGLFSRNLQEPDEDALQIYAVLGSQVGQFFQRRWLEDNMAQSQKMETVGKLAGGIAHEFNSIMTAIIGQSEMLAGSLTRGSEQARSASEIRQAADRAATLTRQLLAYGRRQIMQSEVFDLNKLVTGMESMLLHLLDARVNLRIIAASEPLEVNADAGQIEQVVLNVIINAREAMPMGGKLTLEVGGVQFSEEKSDRNPELKPGSYVLLAITDTGLGMSPEVKARVFDPFFSTKEVGEGSGLGLATSYGIVKQSGGHITIYSEPGRGTSVKVYLPRAQASDAIVAPAASAPVKTDIPGGRETILLVEDDAALREMEATFLTRQGYIVLAAANGMDALALMERREGPAPDLLFTDVVLPQIDGKVLSDRLRALHPTIKVLYTSAYTENAIVHQGVLNPGVALLQKPFSPSAMAHKVREVLDQP